MPMNVLEIDAPKFMKYCESNPDFGFKFMHRIATTLAQRLSGTRLQLLEMAGVHLPTVQLEFRLMPGLRGSGHA